MVAPSYAEARRELAMKIGLGRPRTPTKRGAGSDEGGGARQNPAHESQGCLSPPSGAELPNRWEANGPL